MIAPCNICPGSSRVPGGCSGCVAARLRELCQGDSGLYVLPRWVQLQALLSVHASSRRGAR